MSRTLSKRAPEPNPGESPSGSGRRRAAAPSVMLERVPGASLARRLSLAQGCGRGGRWGGEQGARLLLAPRLLLLGARQAISARAAGEVDLFEPEPQRLDAHD